MKFLLEVGSEEIPAGYIAGAVDQLKGSLEKGLQDAELEFEQVKVFSTPRRLAVLIKGLPKAQKEKTIEKVGPRVEVAYLPDGKTLSKAGEGFCAAVDVMPARLRLFRVRKAKTSALASSAKGKAPVRFCALWHKRRSPRLVSLSR